MGNETTASDIATHVWNTSGTSTITGGTTTDIFTTDHTTGGNYVWRLFPAPDIEHHLSALEAFGKNKKRAKIFTEWDTRTETLKFKVMGAEKYAGHLASRWRSDHILEHACECGALRYLYEHELIDDVSSEDWQVFLVAFVQEVTVDE